MPNLQSAIVPLTVHSILGMKQGNIIQSGSSQTFGRPTNTENQGIEAKVDMNSLDVNKASRAIYLDCFANTYGSTVIKTKVTLLFRAFPFYALWFCVKTSAKTICEVPTPGCYIMVSAPCTSKLSHTNYYAGHSNGIIDNIRVLEGFTASNSCINTSNLCDTEATGFGSLGSVH